MIKKTFLIAVITFLAWSSNSWAQDPNFHIYLCFGQSNMQGATRAQVRDTIPVPGFQMMSPMDCPDLNRTRGEWYPAVPPLANCNAGLSPSDYFGRKMAENMPKDVKVGVINVAVGGCKIELYDKDNYKSYVETAPDWMLNWINEYGGNPYGRLVELAKKAQKDGVIKGILLHQGESNTGDTLWPKKVKGVYEDLLKDLNLEGEKVPLLAGELLSEDQNGACASMNEIINTLPEVIPNSYVIASDGCEGIPDRLHFSASGYRKLGKRYADQMLQILGNVPTTIELNATSPDTKIRLTVKTENGRPTYSLSYDGKPFLLNAPLGLDTNLGDFTSNMVLKDSLVLTTVSDSYSLNNIKKSSVIYKANQAVFTFLKDGINAFDLIFNISNNDVAFRYKIYPQEAHISCVVKTEATGFRFPEKTKSFLSNMMTPMTGFARTAPSYESGYGADIPLEETKAREGYVFPGLFHTENNLWVLVSETGVHSQYPASHLSNFKEGAFTVDFPNDRQNNGFGSSGAQMGLPGHTPWRTITVGETLKPIVETTIPFDVVKPLYEPSKDYQYGRGTWSWIIWQDASMNYEDQVKYIDLAAEMNYEYILIDAWWDRRIGYERMEELITYAKSKGIAVFLWYNSNGTANDAFQTPKDKMNTSIARKKEMKWLKEAGVKGIKSDFFGGDKQETMRLYEDILSDANDYGLMVVFHGATLPRGWERMFPNYAGSEAVLASEMLVFSEDVRQKEAFYATLHPFMRNTVGSMEFGGTVLNKFFNKGNEKGQKRLTSDVFQLATAVLYQNPVQFFALTPNNLNDAPNWAMDFMISVPTTWDETMYLDGYPGKYVVLARRHEQQWFVVGVNAQEETLDLNLTLPMFAKGDELTVFQDDATLTGRMETIKLKKDKQVTIKIPSKGGIIFKNK
ncbi:glycoside hydrolase family 97 catalytic domain-containing protein [Pareuzebyella sediminis]|uniref:glycoside hydrolase family 97 catalytic domain-containing protein n=1 Tax=Pareuzebyella sediminis TaxID=2607998 RepID=UPI001E47EAEB|nr:glycoside hydrolase family 97 catalytic domain-containing protein [Pareuzebyella sediminis]